MTKAQMNYSIGYTMHLRNNTLLQGGKYKIVRFIASGGFGCTYEAHHTLLDSRVALKEFFVGDFCNRDEATGQVTIATKSKEQLVGKLKKKFMDEARALFKMKHPGIVRVIDIFEENGTAYYAMEYIEGQSLSDVVKKRGKLPEAEAVGYIRQVAEALKYVHSLNRLHLDIKPGNIMLNKDGKAVLIDFGASKHYDDETGENTSTLLGINTKGYAPVEQVNQSFKSFSPATDIYALGATLYKLLTGITPPPSNMLNSDEATLTPLPSSISSSTRNAVESAMQLLRKNRPQSVEEWICFLSHYDKLGNENFVEENNSDTKDNNEVTFVCQEIPQKKQKLPDLSGKSIKDHTELRINDKVDKTSNKHKNDTHYSHDLDINPTKKYKYVNFLCVVTVIIFEILNIYLCSLLGASWAVFTFFSTLFLLWYLLIAFIGFLKHTILFITGLLWCVIVFVLIILFNRVYG